MTEVTARYCPMCGRSVSDGTWDRFGEWCCSEAHAEEYATEVRGQKQRQIAGAAASADSRPGRRWGSCCG